MTDSSKRGASPVRVRDQVCFTVYVLAETMPDVVRVRDHLFPFEGMQADPALLWGVYGTTSTNDALFIAERYARQNKRTLLTVSMWYHIPKFSLTRRYLTEEAALESGYLHFARLSKDYRDKLLGMANVWAKKHVHASARMFLPGLTLDEFVRRYPAFIRYLFKEYPQYGIIVHPVQQSYDLTDQTVIWVATVRADGDRVKRAEVRFMPDIPVDLT